LADQHRQRALKTIQNQRGGGEAFIAGTQHISGADIAGADGADVAQPRSACEHEPKRD
jgi:hypothetical protein